MALVRCYYIAQHQNINYKKITQQSYFHIQVRNWSHSMWDMMEFVKQLSGDMSGELLVQYYAP